MFDGQALSEAWFASNTDSDDEAIYHFERHKALQKTEDR